MKLLLFTSRKYERFLDRCVSVLQRRTRNMPIAVVSDTGRFAYPFRFIHDANDWTSMALGGVRKALDEGYVESFDHVVVAMEDHIPQRELDFDSLSTIEKFVTSNGIHYFNLLGLKGGETVSFEQGILVRRLRESFYCSLTPAIWKVDHFLRLLEVAHAQSMRTPWQFEHVPSPELHCTSNRAVWPTVTDGFMAGGRVNRAGLGIMRRNLDSSNATLFMELLMAYMIERSSRFLGLETRVYR